MAITTKIFGNCSGSDFISGMKTTLENSGLFDSVTYSNNNSGVYCIKDDVRLVTIRSKNSESSLAFEFKNTSGSTITSLDWSWDNRSDTYKRYGSVSAVGDSVYIMFSGVSNGSVYNQVIFISVYVGKTDDGNIAMYYSRQLANINEQQEWEYRAFCSESYDSGGVNTIGAPISSSERFINTYRIIGGLSEGMSLFKNAYGIRYSPPLHTNRNTAVGITPVKVSIDDNDFLTDGIILIKDAE
jgi:hypothetical protein